MRGDGDDLRYDPIPPQGDIVAEALLAVHAGSKPGFRSPFLHTSRDYFRARGWLASARARDRRCYLVRVDLAQFPNDQVIDISSHDMQRRFIGERQREYKIQKLMCTDHESPLHLSMKYKEVLLCARGAIPQSFFEPVEGP